MKRPTVTPSPSRTAPRVIGRAGRLVLIFAAMAQLFGVVAGPLDHWRASTRMGPHVEPAGTSESHYQHDEATCAACAIGHMAASPIRRVTHVSLSVRGTLIARKVAQLPPFRAPRTQAPPRAPPAFVRVG